MKHEILQEIEQHKIIAICRGIEPDEILQAVEAVAQGGIFLFEVTFNQKDPDGIQKASEEIRLLVKEGPAGIHVGAGTVMTLEQLSAALQAGAEFFLAPNVNETVIRSACEYGILSIPGAATASEVVNAYQAGADIVKIFPAGLLGPAYIRALRGPLSNIPLMAVGNIDPHNFRDFLNAGCMSIGVGSNIMNLNLIHEKRFHELTTLAQAYAL
jgi:2-dehydro-3-deoxyphosphogluconate aldolase/(4S)-4-hydroxy-2-oxoglutarate aldolase